METEIKADYFFENEFSPRTRKISLNNLKEQEFDLFVIGGGITGAGVACEASSRGFKVALVEMNDFASGTSSKSTKLLHGGLRYLEKFEFKLVFESLKDRNKLFKAIPTIARPLSFIVPVYKGNKEGVTLLNLGLSVYDFLSLVSLNMVTKIHKLLKPKRIFKYEPDIRKEELKGAIQYYDGSCDDARLTIENIKTASALGSTIVNYTQVIGFEKDEQGKANIVIIKDLKTNEEIKVKAKAILNASGPWVDSVNKKDNTEYKNKLKPTKGIHLILPKITEGNAIFLKTRTEPVRWFFIVPYGEYSLVGTTDTEAETTPDDYSYLENDNYASSDDIQYILDSVNFYYPNCNFTEKHIISSYGGWRPLIAPPEASGMSESDISREHEIFETDSGIVSIAGGKLTTYMSMSEEIVDYITKKKDFKEYKKNKAGFPKLLAWNSEESLPKYLMLESRKYNFYERPLIRSLIHKYGTDYEKVLQIINSSPEMKVEVKNLSKGVRCYRGEVIYSIFYEMTMNIKDFMMRRHRIILRDKNQGLRAVEEIAELMSYTFSDMMNWSEKERLTWKNNQVLEYQAEVKKVNSGLKLK
jgi:glycerol-3-phosphate dehydrogenase